MFLPGNEEEQKNAEENESECCNKLALRAMIRIIFVTVVVERVNEGMKDQRGKPYE